MNAIQTWLARDVFFFLLAFCRLGSAFIFVPGIGEAFIPLRIRLVFALLVTFCILPLLYPFLPVQPERPPELIRLIGQEMAIGIYFGLLVRLYLLALQFSGMFMATQMGLATALVQDPISAQQSAALGNLLSLAALLTIVLSGLDHFLLKALVGTYEAMPPGAPLPTGDMALLFTKVVGQSLILALQIAAPYFLYGILFFLGLGVMSRLMPQLQVFFIALPLQVLGGIALLALTSSVLLSLFAQRYGDFLRGLF